MITWGISANSHDAALAVFDGNELKFASHSERFSGKKNDPHLHKDLIAYAKQWGEPNEVVWYERPWKKTLRQLYAGQGWRWSENNIRSYLDSYGIQAPFTTVDHHHSHAAAGYFTSGFSNATVICLDSIGEFETLTIWEGADNDLTKVYSQGYPDSVGLWYSAMTQRIGLKPNEDEYILMGMAAYGDPHRFFKDILNDFINIEGIGFNPHVKMRHNLHKGCLWWKPELQTEQDFFDIAAATQKVYEHILHNTVIWAKKSFNSRNLVLMGGCALNCSANSWLFNEYENVWIMPNPGDAGSAIGAVLADRNQHIEWLTPYLGYDIKGAYPIEQLLETLKTDRIVGVANGPSEFGPRALGNRSLLADPRGEDIKDTVNEIKRRQKFRPFSPMILEEHADDYFVMPTQKTPFMQFTAKCKDPISFPAIVHADGTSRVQTVSQQDHPQLYQLLQRWYEETGCPMLLNTSLNIKGQPIVNDQNDAKAFETHYGVKVF